MKSQKGFTLIELLVVIAIIGILSGIVLTSLNTARSKSKDAAVKSELASARSQAELDADGSDYTTVCASPSTQLGIILAKIGTDGGDSTGVCKASTGAISFSSKLPSGNGNWCVDNAGNAKATLDADGDGDCD